MVLENIVVLIPALNPNHKLVDLVKELNQIGLTNVVVIDDGSENSSQAVFDEVQTYRAKVYHHENNRGKGAALRTGIEAMKKSQPHIIGVVTADADGQHAANDILKVVQNWHYTMISCSARGIFPSRKFPWRTRGSTLRHDELVTKVKQDAERIWVWTAVAAQSKLILAIHIGRRSSADAHHLLHQVWQRLAPDSLPIFTSDGLNLYFYGITAHFGFWDKPPRARKHHWFPDARLQYAQLRKRRRGWRVSFLYSIIRLGSRQLIRSGLKALSLTGKVQTAFVERANLTLRELIAPLSRRTWSTAFDRHHLRLHIQWGLAYYHFCRPHQSLTTPIRGPSKRCYRTPVTAAKLVRRRWSVQDLLQLPVPEGIWLDSFPATQGCR